MLDERERLAICGQGLCLGVRDHAFDDLADAVHDEARGYFSTRREDFQRGAVGGISREAVVDQRSDLRVWVTPDLCTQHQLTATASLVRRMVGWCKDFKAPLSLNGEYSVQLTCYPGNGTRYVKHRDAFTVAAHGADPKRAGHRKLTFVCYLNKEWEGGHLRIHLSADQARLIPGPGHLDVEPKLGRVVAFRGDIVEHEVLPSFLERFAITLWAYSTDEPSLPPPCVLAQAASPRVTSLQMFLRSFNTPAEPPPLICEESFPTRSIFVSIANFRDPEGLKTIASLFLTARYPMRVFIAHVFQGEPSEDVLADFSQLQIEGLPADVAQCLHSAEHVRVLRLPTAQATGPCLARHFATKLWRGEEFFLQIDSHMRFRRNWDDHLIALWERVRKQEDCASPVLTTYPPAYSLPDSVPADMRPTVLLPKHFGEDRLLRQSACLASLPGTEGLYLRSPLWASGFSFSHSEALLRVDYSPRLPSLFFGEESAMAARLFTHGFDFFAPGEAVCFHLYSRQHRPVFNASAPASEEQARRAAEKLRSQEAVRDLLVGGRSCDPYGLGSARTLREFEESCGVCFAQQRVLRSDHEVTRFVGSTCPALAAQAQGKRLALFTSVNVEEVDPVLVVQRALENVAGEGTDSQRLLSLVQRFL